MTDQKTDETILGDYLRGKSAFSDLYQRLSANEPSAGTDATILAAAKRATSAKSRHRHWAIPAAIAALLLVGISLLWWQQQSSELTTNKESAAPPSTGTLPQQIDRTLHNNPIADQWLVKILKLHNAGNTAEAAKEYKKFRQTYPAYSIDQQRFGALQQYDKE